MDSRGIAEEARNVFREIKKLMVPRAGIEPTTHCLEGSCSIL